MGAPRKLGLLGRIGIALFLSLFVLAFGAGGLVIGVRPLWHALKEAPRLQHYVPVPARVLDVRMEEDSDGDLHPVVRYQYQYSGRTLTGDRIAWSLNSHEQKQWHARLEAAQRTGQTVTAWIDPEHPGMALLDREPRWRQLAFLLPFALIFPAVGLGALVALIAVLRGPHDTPADGLPVPPPSGALRDNSKAKAWGITIFTLLWNLIAFPIALAVWADREGWRFADVFVGLFPAVGLLMAWAAVATWRQALRHRGSALTLDNDALHAGEPSGLTLHLPPARWRHADASGWKARLVQSRLPHDDSERSEETLSEQVLPLSIHPTGDGGAHLRMKVHWPAHAQRSGIDKEGHRISWRLIVEEAKRRGEQVFDLPVQAGRPGFVVTPTSTAAEAPLPAATAEAVPPTVMWLSQEHGLQLAHFTRPWRVGGAIAIGLFSLGLAVASRQHFHAEESADALIWLLGMLGSMLTIGLALHVGTRRWVVGITPGAWWLDRSSSLRRHFTVLAVAPDSALAPRLTHTQKAHGQAAGHHLLEQWDSNTLRRQSVTPPLPGLGVALGAAEQLQKLRQQAKPRADAATFTARSPTARERISTLTGWLLLTVISLAFATHLDAALSLTANDTARAWLRPVHQQFNALLSIGLADQALLRAIDAADERAVRKALRDGANPSATSDSGRSVLMLAAGRGLLPIMDTLLQHGADVNYADQISVNERGDTALLMAAYFGQPEAFEKLLAAGARTDVANRWGWTPVHMAAMGDCVPCLDTLLKRGLPLNTRATASRGESPLQLAAAKGRIAAMQWLLDHGADASQRDDHGQDVFAWASFFKQGDSERWLREHLPPR
ncbi:MAG TPA: ankyrin repeat domain-containing protein [Candidatus Aquabacterium excrementipullorum]|nr:ankyrin repeat domain-containing protein [Candidatus Aquabacterium excrementipullorum]